MCRNRIRGLYQHSLPPPPCLPSFVKPKPREEGRRIKEERAPATDHTRERKSLSPSFFFTSFSLSLRLFCFRFMCRPLAALAANLPPSRIISEYRPARPAAAAERGHARLDLDLAISSSLYIWVGGRPPVFASVVSNRCKQTVQTASLSKPHRAVRRSRSNSLQLHPFIMARADCCPRSLLRPLALGLAFLAAASCADLNDEYRECLCPARRPARPRAHPAAG